MTAASQAVQTTDPYQYGALLTYLWTLFHLPSQKSSAKGSSALSTRFLPFCSINPFLFALMLLHSPYFTDIISASAFMNWLFACLLLWLSHVATPHHYLLTDNVNIANPGISRLKVCFFTSTVRLWNFILCINRGINGLNVCFSPSTVRLWESLSFVLTISYILASLWRRSVITWTIDDLSYFFGRKALRLAPMNVIVHLIIKKNK